MRILTALVLVSVAACSAPAETPLPEAAPAAAPVAAPDPWPAQIEWQRSLDDALALQAASGRSILVAVNTDAESASERIVREIYRDPEFVARTREFICVIASPYRHTPRDHDGSGRRVVDPRFGAITGSEAVALEPQIFDRFLGGDRIAPRHALIRPDESKVFDLFQLYDFWDIDRALAEASEGERFEGALEPLELDEWGEPSWEALAGARSNANRTHFEDHLASIALEDLPPVLDAIAAHGNAGSLEALRVVLSRAAQGDEDLHSQVAATARALDLGGPLAFVLWAQLLEVDDPELVPRLLEGGSALGEEASLLPLLGDLGRDLASMQPGGLVTDPDASTKGLRAYLMTHLSWGWGDEQAGARAALDLLLGPETRARIEAASDSQFQAVPGSDLAGFARSEPPTPALEQDAPAADMDALADELERLEQARSENREDPVLALAQARATLAMARARLDAGQGGADWLLEDALASFEEARAAFPGDVPLRLEMARAAFLSSRFELQEEVALEAAELWRAEKRPLSGDEASAFFDLVWECERWIGDAAARLLLQRFGGDPEVEILGVQRAARSLGIAAQDPAADETDWTSLTSLYGAIGRRRLELGFVLEGLRRFPESQSLRATLGALARSTGLPELETRISLELAEANPNSAACAWYAGYAQLLAGEWSRRAEDPVSALEHYAAADEHFQRSIELEPSYTDNSTHYRAMCALGSGFAHLLASERSPAAEELVRAIALRPEVAGVRDGLDREALDLLDGALEWRSQGPSPVAPLRLAERLSSLVPASPEWMRSVSDSELREALRAAGRGEPDGIVEGYLDASIDAGRRALLLADGFDERKALAQALTVLAERKLEVAEGSLEGVAEWLNEAAPLQGLESVPEDAPREVLAALAASLRELLGEARPVTRPGR